MRTILIEVPMLGNATPNANAVTPEPTRSPSSIPRSLGASERVIDFAGSQDEEAGSEREQTCCSDEEQALAPGRIVPIFVDSHRFMTLRPLAAPWKGGDSIP